MTGGRTILIAAISAAAGGTAGWFAHVKSVSNARTLEAADALRQGKPELALRLAKIQLLKSDGADAEAQRIFARSLARLQKWSEAVNAFDQAVFATSEDYSLSAKSLFLLKRPTEALAVVEKGLAAFPGDPSLSELETRVLGIVLRTKDALTSAERLAAIPGKEVTGKLLSGMIHYDARNFQQAAEALRRALALSPDLSGQSPEFSATTVEVVNEMIAASLVASGAAAEAGEFAVAAYRAKPSARHAYLAAKGAHARGDVGELSIWLERLLQHEPDHWEGRLLQIESMLDQKRIDEAKASLEKLSTRQVPSSAIKHQLDVARARIVSAKSKRK